MNTEKYEWGFWPINHCKEVRRLSGRDHKCKLRRGHEADHLAIYGVFTLEWEHDEGGAA